MSKLFTMKRAFLSAAVLLIASAAWAYIPPSQFVLRSWAKKHYGYKHILVRSVVTQLDNGQPTPVHFRELAIFYPPTGLLRSWASDDHGVNLYETEQRGKELSPLAALLFEPNASIVAQTLKAKGIPVLTEPELQVLPTEEDRRGAEKEFLARWNGTVAWVIGTEGPRDKTPGPQLWVEKDSFLPLRLIAQLLPDSSDMQDLQLENYKYYREFPYPKLITWVRQDKQPILKVEMTEIAVDAGSDMSRAKLTEGYTDAGNSAPGRLRDLIKSYYQAVR